MDWTTIYANRMSAIGHSDVVAILKLAERPDVISFAGGLPDPTTFLLDEIKETLDDVLAQHGRVAFGYGPTHGITPLREWLAEHMTRMGRPSSINECLVTTGGIAALDLICKVVLNPGDRVIVAEPTYLAALHVIKSYEGRFTGVPIDEGGIQSEALESRLSELSRQSIRPKFIYLVPSFQNPSGITLSENRRRKIVALSEEYGVPIVEDAAYRDLRFEGEAPPLLAALDSENVIHINTFSKIFNPGVRIGWVTASKELIDTLALAKQGQDQCTSTVGQYLAFSFADQGLIDRQVAAAVPVYRRKRDLMLAALQEHFPAEIAWTRPEGGFYTWLTLPDGVDTEALLPQAIEQASVAYVAGPAFYHNRKGQKYMRLCYSYVSESQIKEGMSRLAQIVSEVPVDV